MNDQERSNPFALTKAEPRGIATSRSYTQRALPVARSRQEREIVKATREDLVVEAGIALKTEVAQEIQQQMLSRQASLLHGEVAYLAMAGASIRDERARLVFEDSIARVLVTQALNLHLELTDAAADQLRSVVSNDIRPGSRRRF